MADLPDVERLVAHWKKQVRILVDAGVSLEPIAASLRRVALEVESDWFCSFVEAANARAENAPD